MAPIGSPLRSIGTERMVRRPALTMEVAEYSGSAATSGIWTTARRRIARPTAVPVKKDLAAASFARFGGAARDGVEHRLQLGWRTRDHAQDFGSGRLLLQ